VIQRELITLDEHKAWQHCEWRIQKIGWWIWMSLLGAGLLGLIGHGPFSRKTHSSTDRSLSMVWERFEHLHAPTRLEITVRPEAGEREATVEISEEFWSSIEVHRIQPEPSHTDLLDDGVRLCFSIQPDVSAATILLYFEFESSGIISGNISFQGQAIDWRQFVYP
jgi:hypothetical protein